MFVSSTTVDRQGSKKGNFPVLVCHNAVDWLDSALKDMAIVMKQLDRSDEAIEAIKSFRHLCPYDSQEFLGNVLVELYKVDLFAYKARFLGSKPDSFQTDGNNVSIRFTIIINGWFMHVGLRPRDQRQITPALPLHLVDVITVGDGVQSFSDASGMHSKNTPLSSNNISGQGTLLQV
ncbi:protein pollenless 3 [Quercus suber]|uniref:Protein pollenless 3 n=1 Tax=Quercus suber TaxID=58331 RepID=A0AAW0IMI7_QUESU